MSRILMASSFLLLLMISCSDEALQDPIPFVFVEVDVNLNDTDNQPLQADNGYVYLLGGYKGIILYRVNENVYRAFDRASPVNTTDACAVLDVDSSGLFIVDPCSGATYNFEGLPISSPSPFSLRQYNVFKDDNWLYIRSE